MPASCSHAPLPVQLTSCYNDYAICKHFNHATTIHKVHLMLVTAQYFTHCVASIHYCHTVTITPD